VVVRITVTILPGFVRFSTEGVEVDAEGVGEPGQSFEGGGVEVVLEAFVVAEGQVGGPGHGFLGEVLLAAQES
jgi:hypothetical protein